METEIPCEFAEAVNEAVKLHEKTHPESHVYRICDVRKVFNGIMVELEAEHFSTSLKYLT